MTEEDALTKVCCGPFQSESYSDLIKCRGSECMAWRWIYKFEEDAMPTRDNPPEGYCGLAGYP